MRASQACFGVLAAFVTMQGNALASSRRSMSPVGQEISGSVHKKVEPEFMGIMRKRSDTRKQIALQLQADHPDWKMLKALLDEDFLDEMRMRKISKLIDADLLDKLPEADRIIFLRDKFPSGVPQVIMISPKP